MLINKERERERRRRRRRKLKILIGLRKVKTYINGHFF